MRAACLVVALLLAIQAPGGGIVEKVVDGDTLVISGAGSVRLLGIDTPELSSTTEHRCALKARDFLAGLVGRSRVSLVFEGQQKDTYGRWLAFVRLSDGRIANAELVRSGWARVYRGWWFSKEAEYLRFQADAQRAGAGIWATGQSACASEPPNVIYHGNRRSRVYHAPGCPYYDCDNCTAIFESRRAAEAAGFTAHRDCVK
jgi:micrococcal nuclease